MMNVKLLSFLLILFRLFCLGKGGKTYFSKPFKQGSPKQKILKHEQALYKAKMKQWESQRALLEVEEDLEISVGNRTLIPPDCYKPTKYDYISPRQCYTSMQRVNEFPPPCITNESQLAFINGSFSADATFYNCLANVPDAGSIASFYNGRYHGCSLYQSYITLLNLVKVSHLKVTFLPLCNLFHLFRLMRFKVSRVYRLLLILFGLIIVLRCHYFGRIRN